MTPPVSSEDMISERARVLRVADGIAWVHCESQAGCARCAAGEGCGGGVFARLLRGRLQELPLALPGPMADQVAAGDWVLVGLSTRAVQAASMLLYGLPLLGLVVGASAGDLWLGGDLAALAGAVAGLVAGFLAAHARARRLADDPGMAPVLLRRLLPGEACPARGERRQ